MRPECILMTVRTECDASQIYLEVEFCEIVMHLITTFFFSYRWWGENNSIYGKHEPNRIHYSSSERSICIWSCRASISLKSLLGGLESRPWVLSICENWHCTICMYDLNWVIIHVSSILLLVVSMWSKCLSCSLKSSFQMILKMICAIVAIILESFGVYGEGKFEWKYG